MRALSRIGLGVVLFWALWWVPLASVGASELADTIEKIKPSVVGVGTFQPTRSPRAQLLGTGFVVGDGRHVITNDHVIPHMLDSENREHLAIFIPGRGGFGRDAPGAAGGLRSPAGSDLAAL